MNFVTENETLYILHYWTYTVIMMTIIILIIIVVTKINTDQTINNKLDSSSRVKLVIDRF